ncbi:hypothetical protein SAMN05444149_105396 [Pseudosulfitobacter pseudonitzschiae]|uniref:Uncharacterized protein n=1 Tax=Pseudosulfitobacter pseudonitzschiae TaxID=1402135 RepID=A0A073J880_9RHOB|nr:hypothetical protein [Pseudosulfitobacter pseudonitzschiae]KEJ93917.1 hypothetical protein SUH3_12080 [Pseudosulfitobacter pseudonitzschiae]QKS08539.1 hypothetical protein HT745_08645 [Pseudosulfitobacter pseudonitzschiae]SHF77662.1 hypothetical protein SAMN05444149_105396 [Pseudosulfitobacter pseudonitzschiae]
MSNARELEDYRVRPAIVMVTSQGHEGISWRAERRIKLLWLIPIWIPVMNAGWRDCPSDAWDDATRDYDLRKALRVTKEGN